MILLAHALLYLITMALCMSLSYNFKYRNEIKSLQREREWIEELHREEMKAYMKGREQ